MDEHDDDLESEVIEGQEIERDTFDPADDEFLSSAKRPEEDEGESSAEDDSEI